MKPHSGAAITMIANLWPHLKQGQTDLPFVKYGVHTDYLGKTKLHKLTLEHYNSRSSELIIRIGHDWACYLKVRLNIAREEVDFNHSHSSVREVFTIRLPRKVSGEYMSEIVAGFSTKHVIEGDLIDNNPCTQIRFSDCFEGDAENPLVKYNYQYQCKITSQYTA